MRHTTTTRNLVHDRLRELARAQAMQKAREAAMERLALISFAIWATLALAYYILVLVPFEAHPVWGMLGGLALLVPAALPWLVYRRLVETGARERIETEYSALVSARAPAQDSNAFGQSNHTVSSGDPGPAAAGHADLSTAHRDLPSGGEYHRRER